MKMDTVKVQWMNEWTNKWIAHRDKAWEVRYPLFNNVQSSETLATRTGWSDALDECVMHRYAYIYRERDPYTYRWSWRVQTRISVVLSFFLCLSVVLLPSLVASILLLLRRRLLRDKVKWENESSYNACSCLCSMSSVRHDQTKKKKDMRINNRHCHF